jgi:hypothetical protein
LLQGRPAPTLPALFDLGFLAEMGFELGEAGRVLDTMLISQVLEDKENA